MAKTRSGTARAAKAKTSKGAEPYRHPDKTSPMRPDVGTQPQFRKKKPPKTYRYDSSLSPALAWDGQNGARELAEWLLGLIDRASTLDPPHEFATPEEFRSSDGRDELARVKAAAAARWVAAVNADGPYGRWEYAMARKVSEVRNILERQRVNA